MKRHEYLLSVTSAASRDVVSIHGDRAGLTVLRDRINHLLATLEQGECDHDHLRSPDWAGFDLTTTMLATERESGNGTVHHLEIFAWTPEWRAKHDL